MPYGQDPLSALRRFIPAGSPLTAEDIVRGAAGTGVDPRALAVIARKETEFGRTAGRFRNNAYGYGVHLGSDVNTSPSWEAGTRKVAEGLSGGLYKGAGITRLRDVIMKYAPPSENNTDLYIKQVEDWYRSMGGDPNGSIFNGGTGSQRAGGRRGTVADLPDPPPNPNDRTSELAASLQEAFGSRKENESLFRTVMRGAMASMASQADPQGSQQALGAVQNATKLLGGPAQQEVVKAARTQLGVKYVWGGTTPNKGLDCSGLTQWAWAQAGVKIPRVTYDQIHTGVGINAKDQRQWRPGDLLFPHEGHVMMYIGNGNAIHAPRTGDVVRIVPANSRSYIAVRRPR